MQIKTAQVLIALDVPHTRWWGFLSGEPDGFRFYGGKKRNITAQRK